MLVSMNWIRDFVCLDGLDIEELIHRFTLSTAEVEDVCRKGADTRNVVAARIISVENHPDSKKLHLLKVDAGDAIYDCVCGAPNVREGMLAAFAKEGGMVSGMAINRATVAGYVSQGMCCSAAELGISADNAGILELTDDIALGTDIKSIYGIEDIVFEVDNKSLTNRPDLWGHYGIAREFSALSGRPLLAVQCASADEYSALPPVDIRIEDAELAYRYTGIKVGNITKKISPLNMQIRLYYCGIRAINLLADLTNYVMLELGQPMHAFDADKIGAVRIKRFDKDFTFTTLDSVERRIDSSMLMICSDNTPVAIAGVMGGLDSEITEDTGALLLESACFSGISVRKTSTKLGLRTDASMRYEKTLDPELTVVAAKRFLKLLMDIDGGVQVQSCLSDDYAYRYPEITITIDKIYVDRYTGIDISEERIKNTLEALGFTVQCGGGTFTVTVPSWRATKDVTIAADLIEEITRIYGYDNFDIATSESALYPVRRTAQQSCESAIKDLLVHKYNMHEVHSYIWCDTKKYREIGIEAPENVRIVNAMTPENEILRKSMIPSLLTFAGENRAFAPEFAMFDSGRVVSGLDAQGNCVERKRLGILLYSRISDEKTLYFRLRGIISHIGEYLRRGSAAFTSAAADFGWEHPVNRADISFGGRKIGIMAAVHPTCLAGIDKKSAIVFAELDLDDIAAVPEKQLTYAPPLKYPGMEIDLTFLTDGGVTYGDIASAWEGRNIEYLRETHLADVYSGERSSITVRLFFAAEDRTLARAEIQPMVDGIIAYLDGKGILLKK